MTRKQSILYLSLLIFFLFVGGFFFYKSSKNTSSAQGDFKVGDVVDEWKVSKAIKNQWIDGAFYDSYTMFEGKIRSVVRYHNSTGDDGTRLYIYLPDNVKIPTPMHDSLAWIMDKSFPYDISEGSYGTMEVIINKIQKIEASIDSDGDGYYISKILGFNELGRAEILYEDNDEARAKKQDEELNNFLGSKSFEIKPTLPFSVLSVVKSANIEEIKKLISTYKINYRDGLGDTLLHIALKTNSSLVVNFLFDQSDIDLNAKNILGQTPLHIAAMNGQLDNLKLLISKGANVKDTDRYRNNLLHIAANKNHSEIIKYLLDNSYIDINEKNSFDRMSLFYSKDYNITKALIDKGAKLSELPDGGEKLTEIAVGQKNKEFIELLLNSNPEIRSKVLVFHRVDEKDLLFAKFLLDKGFDIDLADDVGRSALHSATKDFAEFLLKNGANPNIQNHHDGGTALHSAAFFTKVDNIELLLKYGSNPNITNNKGLTPLDIIKNQKSYLPLEKEDVEKRKRAINVLEKAVFNSDHSFKSNSQQ